MANSRFGRDFESGRVGPTPPDQWWPTDYEVTAWNQVCQN
jgi:hypothetical protein